ncbi:MAG: YciI family protein [Pseudomonadota bacterium]
MLFAVTYLDRDNPGDIRPQFRDAHIAYRKGLGRQLLLAGPLLSASGSPMGSLVLLEAENLSKASDLANADPYAVAGLFKDIAVHNYRIMVTNLPAGS